jgi:hypothetical protein
VAGGFKTHPIETCPIELDVARHQVLKRKAGLGHTGFIVFGRVCHDVINLVSDHTRNRSFQNLAAHWNTQRPENWAQGFDQKSAVDLKVRQNTISDNNGIPERSAQDVTGRIWRQCVHRAGTGIRSHHQQFEFPFRG